MWLQDCELCRLSTRCSDCANRSVIRAVENIRSAGCIPTTMEPYQPPNPLLCWVPQSHAHTCEHHNRAQTRDRYSVKFAQTAHPLRGRPNAAGCKRPGSLCVEQYAWKAGAAMWQRDRRMSLRNAHTLVCYSKAMQILKRAADASGTVLLILMERSTGVPTRYPYQIRLWNSALFLA